MPIPPLNSTDNWVRKRSSLIPSLALVSLSCIGGFAIGAPTVEGQTILLPEDGWYQVQNREDYRQICAGVRSCEVDAGTYIVINHTTGERFERVTVESNPVVNTNQLTINADGISWPGDGWYQVQRASDFESLCQGGRSCSLTAGTYIVINHTTGQRWENVIVSGNGGSSDPSLQAINLHYQRYSSSAIELFWSRQAGAQSPIIYTVFQDGVAIDSTKGVSFFIEGLADDQAHTFEIKPFGQPDGVSITVPSSTHGDSPNIARTLSLSNAQEILTGVASVINEEAIDALYESAIEDLNFQNKTFFISNTIDEIAFAEGGEQLPARPLENVYGEKDFYDATRYSTYSCAAGGSLTVYYAYTVNASDTVFDNCVAGSNTYSGTTGIRNLQRGTINRYPMYNFSVTDSNGNTRTLSGGYASGNRSYVTTNSESGWDSAEYRGATDNGELQISNYSVKRTYVDNNATVGSSTRPGDDGELIQIIEYRVENSVVGSFAVSAPWNGYQVLHVSVNLAFNDEAVIARDPDTGELVAYSGSDPEEDFYWQEGSIEVAADDGSRLYITPVDGERDTFLITTGDGETLGPLLWDDGYVVNPLK